LGSAFPCAPTADSPSTACLTAGDHHASGTVYDLLVAFVAFVTFLVYLADLAYHACLVGRVGHEVYRVFATGVVDVFSKQAAGMVAAHHASPTFVAGVESMVWVGTGETRLLESTAGSPQVRSSGHQLYISCTAHLTPPPYPAGT